MILYLHGLNSSSRSSKAIMVRQYCAALRLPCTTPDLPHLPGRAMRLMEALCAGQRNVLAVGSSLGGYYATALAERGLVAGAVLINPAVDVADKLEFAVGAPQSNYTTDERYVMTAAHIKQWRGLRPRQVADPKRYLLLAQTGDELLDYREAKEYYAGAEQLIERGGSHSFEFFERFLPVLARRYLQLPRQAAQSRARAALRTA